MSRPTIRHYTTARSAARDALHMELSGLTGIVCIRHPQPRYAVWIDGTHIDSYASFREAKRALRRPGRRTRMAYRLFTWLADRGVLGDLASRALRRAAYELGVR